MNMDIGAIDIFSTSFNNIIGDGITLTESAKTDNHFNELLKEAAVENVKTDIYHKFNIKVNASDNREECTIPREVLYRMNSDTALREKVYTVLDDYKNTKATLAGYYPPVKKYTLTFDAQGNVLAYLLEPDMEKLEKDLGRSGKKGYTFDRLSLNIYDYNEMINNLLYGPHQNLETQRAILGAYFLQKPKVK